MDTLKFLHNDNLANTTDQPINDENAYINQSRIQISIFPEVNKKNIRAIRQVTVFNTTIPSPIYRH